MKNDDLLEIGEALSFDALREAEILTGKSYKDDKDVATLGLVLANKHNEKKDALLYLTQDTRFDMTLEEAIAIFESLGFKLVYSDKIENTGDIHRIFWNEKGLLLTCDSYYGDKKINSGHVYFNFQGNREAMFKCSNGFAGIIGSSFTTKNPLEIPDDVYNKALEDGNVVWSGNFDVREGLRYTLKMMEDNGKFLKQWIHRPFLWLLNYKDNNKGENSYKAINKSRIALLPEHVRKAITPE